MAAAAEGELDQVMVRAAQILVSLRSRKLRAWPKWVPKPEGEESESSPGTAPAVEVPAGWAVRRPRSRRRRGSCAPWLKALREMELAGFGGEETDAAPAAGSGSPSTSSAGRAAPAQTRPGHAVEKALAAATAAAAAKEPMSASSPNTPLDYGAGGSRASSSADDAARPREKRKSPGARGSGGGEDDEGCSSPAKRTRAAADEVMKPIPTEQSMQIETSATSSKGFAFDLNFPPPSDDGAC